MVDKETMSYPEMLTRAQELFPGATISYSDYNRSWVINTNVEETYDVNPSWVGTPAEEAFNTPHRDGGNELQEWAEYSAYRRESLHDCATAYNDAVYMSIELEKRRTKALEEMGRQDIIDGVAKMNAGDYDEDFPSREQASIYLSLEKSITEEIRKEMNSNRGN